MSIEPSELTSEIWTRWQGHLINGAFPLGRYLGCSNHSGVFLTRAAAHPAEVAIKLVPANRALAESLLPRWKRAGGLTHPHLLRLFEWGGCQLDGLPYLYVVMEYADQTLAQLLQHRVLTDHEAQEMLLPILDALGFLHARSLVHGQLKPANILVVGDRLKLASDTTRRCSEGATNPLTVFDPPEAQRDSSAAAGDIWALGASLLEALTRRPPSPVSEPGETVVLPADFSTKFHDVVSRCLSPDPDDRPNLSELLSWARGSQATPGPPMTIQAADPLPLELTPVPTATQTRESTSEPVPATAEPTPPQTAPTQLTLDAMPHASSTPQSQKSRTLLTILGVLVIVALCWIGLRSLKAPRAPLPLPATAQVPSESSSQRADDADPKSTADAQAPVSVVSRPDPVSSEAATPPPALHQVVPDVPASARRTIRGHIKVWVRVIVDKDGSVSSAAVVRTGSCKYFQRLAIEAAREWTFPPTDTTAGRLMQVRFDFSRDGTTGQAVALH